MQSATIQRSHRVASSAGNRPQWTRASRSYGVAVRASKTQQAPPSVVITGASSGIGRAAALLMAKKGWQVFAGVRKAEDGATLQAAAASQPSRPGGSLTPIIIDVTRPDTISTAVQQVQLALSSQQAGLAGAAAAQEGAAPPGLTALVNNAGKVTLAPLEFMPIEVFEDQMNVNLVGVLRVTQAFMPLMRAGVSPSGAQLGGEEEREGDEEEDEGAPARVPRTRRIVNISSQSGTVALPLFGGYCASKFGLEALSDCLRYELHGQGFDVVCLKPGAVQSDIWSRAHTASNSVLDSLPPKVKELYGSVIQKVDKAARKAEANGASVDEVAALIEKALTKEKPRARYLLGKSAVLQMVVRRLLPDRLWDPLLLNSLNKM